MGPGFRALHGRGADDGDVRNLRGDLGGPRHLVREVEHDVQRFLEGERRFLPGEERLRRSSIFLKTCFQQRDTLKDVISIHVQVSKAKAERASPKAQSYFHAADARVESLSEVLLLTYQACLKH